MNNFKECYDFAEDGKCEPFWDRIYRKAFPSLTNHMRGKPEYCNSQKMGVDRIIYLENGKTLTIDEKIRKQKWDDIALEFISNDKSHTPGWMEKDLHINYLAYAFLPIQTAYLFDWLMLKRVWEHYKDEWKQTYDIIKAQNPGYATHSVCVPINVLVKKVSTATIIELKN